MTSMVLTARSTDPLSSMKAVRKGIFDPVASGLPSLDDFRNFLLDNDISDVIQKYSANVI